MPEVDGRIVARTIRMESPNTPIIMMTGWGVIMKEEGETIPDVDAVVNKPARIYELNDLLLRMVKPAWLV
jgi:CheY-like chemotaxis protein